MATKDTSWATAGFGESAYAALARGMPASEVWSLLLSALRERAEQRTASALAQQWENDRFGRCRVRIGCRERKPGETQRCSNLLRC